MKFCSRDRSNDLFHHIFDHIRSRPELSISQNLFHRREHFIVTKKLRVEFLKSAGHGEKLYSFPLQDRNLFSWFTHYSIQNKLILLVRCVREQTSQTTKLLSLAIQETANSSDHRPHRWCLWMLHSLLVFAKLLD